jgi:hypothetical protein
MRSLAFVAVVLLLSGCAGIVDYCPDGLRDPPWGSGVPDPHKGP